MMLHEHTFRAMNCEMYAAVESDQPHAPALLTETSAWFDGWERTFSRFKSDSELTHINRSGGAWVAVSADMWDVLLVAQRAARDSDGLVLPTLLAALEAAGYDRSFETMPAASATPRHLSGVNRIGAVELDAQRRAVRLCGNAMLDLGGVVKGWCADVAVQRLSHLGAAIVDAGGDIAIGGRLNNEVRMLVDVANPFRSDQPIATLALGACGVATSGRDYRRWRRDGVELHHLIDPRTGRPSDSDVLRATVIAPDAVTAEMASKCALLLGVEAGLAWLEARAELVGLLIRDTGAQISSQRWPQYVADMGDSGN